MQITRRKVSYWFRRSVSVVLMFGVTILGGCVTKKTPDQWFAESQYAEADAALGPLTPKETHQNYMLFEALHASAAFEGGNYLSAEEYVSTLRGGMETVGGDGETMAVVGSEYAKEYRGDPYEKCMAHTYGGFLCLRNNDLESALASFRQAIVADQETRTKDEEKAKDFATGHYFAAVAYNLLGEPENARVHLDEVRKYGGSGGSLSMEEIDKANVFLLIGTGNGPIKTCYGPGGSMVKFVQAADPVNRISFECDGQALGDAALLDDLMVEAKSHGWGEMDSTRLAKGIAKQIVSNLPFVGLAHNLIRSEADLRVWRFLPGKVHAWAGYLEPGIHTFALRCYDSKGNAVNSSDQIWFHVPVKNDEMNFMSFRIVPYRQDIKEKVLVPCMALKDQDR